jgi:hypothetical protein
MRSFIIAATSIAYVITSVPTSNAGTPTRKNNNIGCMDQPSLTGVQHAEVKEFSLSANDVMAVCKLLHNHYANHHHKVDNPEGENKFKPRGYIEVTKIELVALWKTPKSTKELDVFVTQNIVAYSWNYRNQKWEIRRNSPRQEKTKFVFEKKNEKWQAIKTDERDMTIYNRGEHASN